jgi:hypothetical protein
MINKLESLIKEYNESYESRGMNIHFILLPFVIESLLMKTEFIFLKLKVAKDG